MGTCLEAAFIWFIIITSLKAWLSVLLSPQALQSGKQSFCMYLSRTLPRGTTIISTIPNRLLQEALSRGCPVPVGRRLTSKGCWSRMSSCPPSLCTRPHSTQMRILWSNLIKLISMDVTYNPIWKFSFLIMQKNGRKWWITQDTSVSLLRLVLLTLADVFVIFTVQCELRKIQGQRQCRAREHHVMASPTSMCLSFYCT